MCLEFIERLSVTPADSSNTTNDAIADCSNTATVAIADLNNATTVAVADRNNTAADVIADRSNTAADVIADRSNTATVAIADRSNTAAVAIADPNYTTTINPPRHLYLVLQTMLLSPPFLPPSPAPLLVSNAVKTYINGFVLGHQNRLDLERGGGACLFDPYVLLWHGKLSRVLIITLSFLTPRPIAVSAPSSQLSLIFSHKLSNSSPRGTVVDWRNVSLGRFESDVAFA